MGESKADMERVVEEDWEGSRRVDQNTVLRPDNVQPSSTGVCSFRWRVDTATEWDH